MGVVYQLAAHAGLVHIDGEQSIILADLFYFVHYVIFVDYSNVRVKDGLDKSVEAQVLNLLLDLKEAFGLTYLFISHDLEVVRFMATRVLVMYLGKVAELGPTESLYTKSRHPYTSALLGSLLSMDPDKRTERAPLAGDPPNPIDPPPGCRFHTRCVFAEAVCSRSEPALHAAGTDHAAACHMVPLGGEHSKSGASEKVVA